MAAMALTAREHDGRQECDRENLLGFVEGARDAAYRQPSRHSDHAHQHQRSQKPQHRSAQPSAHEHHRTGHGDRRGVDQRVEEQESTQGGGDAVEPVLPLQRGQRLRGAQCRGDTLN
jgi:hypothetical protein